jgi:hypothetical protein
MRNGSPTRGLRNPLPDAVDLLMRSPLAVPVAFMAVDIFDRWFEERAKKNESELTRAIPEGELTQAPLSAEQASQERIIRSMHLSEWPAEDFAAWVRASAS